MRKSDDSTLKQSALYFIAVMSFIIAFVIKAVKAGRLEELLISSTVLFFTYFAIIKFPYLSNVNAELVRSMSFSQVVALFIIPLAIYAVYWIWLFSHEKITSEVANTNWANRAWWWTLNGWEFEEEVAKVFRLNGYKAKVTKKTGDGGIDIILYKDGLKYLVQCKHYQNPIPASYVRELNGVRLDFGADKLVMVASSGATKQALEFLQNKPYFTLYDLEDIIRLGLRPAEDSEEDIIDVEVVETKKEDNTEEIKKKDEYNKIPPFFPY